MTMQLESVLDALAEAVAERVLAKLGGQAFPPDQEKPLPEAVLIDYTEAAALAGISVEALEKRVSRNRVKGVYRSGSRVQFHRAKFLAGLEKDSR